MRIRIFVAPKIIGLIVTMNVPSLPMYGKIIAASEERRKTEQQKDRKAERQRDRKTERLKDKKTKREQKERKKKREREI